MSFPAEVFQVMMASPSDVPDARECIRRAIDEWNSANATGRAIVLLPVSWETGSAPLLGDRAQAIVNQQLGTCDVLIGVFWTRLGTPTGKAPSGTVEEIDRHVRAGSKVMLYFSNQPAAPDSVDVDQLRAVKEAKATYSKMGLVETFETIAELERKLVRQLSIQFKDVASTELTPKDIERMSVAYEPSLNVDAAELLQEAVKDPGGHVLRMTYLGGMNIHTNSRSFVEEGNPRERAKWEAALRSLVDAGYLEPVGHADSIFKVTAEGYRVGDLVSRR